MTHLLTSTLVRGLGIRLRFGFRIGIGIGRCGAVLVRHGDGTRYGFIAHTGGDDRRALGQAVTSPPEVTLTTAGSLLSQDTSSSVPLTFSVPFVAHGQGQDGAVQGDGGRDHGSSGLSMVFVGPGCTSSMGGFSPVMVSLIWSPKMSHTTSAASSTSTTTTTGPKMLGARRLRFSWVRRPRDFFTRPP